MADQEEAPLSAAQRSRIRRLSAPRDPDAGEEAGELNVVPYLDIITNIMMFVLATVSVSFIGSIDTTPPSIGGNRVRADISTKALSLVAMITGQGVALKTSGGSIAPGCNEAGAGITVPNVNNRYDLPSITACVKRLKNASPAFKEETQVTITASSDIDYKTIIDVMDALRADGGEELFPDVHFGQVR